MAIEAKDPYLFFSFFDEDAVAFAPDEEDAAAAGVEEDANRFWTALSREFCRLAVAENSS